MVGKRHSKLLYIESKWFLQNQERSKWKKFVNRDFTPVHLNFMIDFFFYKCNKNEIFCKINHSSISPNVFCYVCIDLLNVLLKDHK